MIRKIPTYLRIIIVVFILILTFILWSIHLNKRFYNSIFRLFPEEVSSMVKNVPRLCEKLTDCPLEPGDILIRRYITSRTKIFDELLNPFFTHSAIYIGNGKLFEALGDDDPPPDQIQITELKESDWFNPDMYIFVVIRPKNYLGKLDAIINDFKNIAEDPEYVFGLSKNGEKRTTCADALVKVLHQHDVILTLPNPPEIITPDYLFLLTQQDSDDFEIIGYGGI